MLTDEQLSKFSDEEKTAYINSNGIEKETFETIHKELLSELEPEKPEHEQEPESDPEPNEPALKKRGRHPIPCDRGVNGLPCDKCKAKQPISEPAKEPAKDNRTKMLDDLKNYKPDPQTSNTSPQAQQTTKFINATILLLIIDTILPMLILWVAGFFDDRYRKIKMAAKKKMKLSASDKAALNEAADQVCALYLGMVNPLWGLGIGLTALYLDKLDNLDESDFTNYKNVAINDVP